MLNPRRDSHAIDKTSSCNGSRSVIRRDSSQLPAPAPPGAIRVIHIFAPKVIKTDVANFRALVQKLTGKSKRGSSSGPGKKRARAAAEEEEDFRTTPSMTTLTSSSSSSEATFSTSTTDTTTNQSSVSTATETCSESSTRSSNSDRPVRLFSVPDSSTTSSAAAASVETVRLFGLPSSFSSAQTLTQIVPAEISAAFFRSQSCTRASTNNSNNNNCNLDQPSSSSSSSSLPRESMVVDPLQSLSGYKDNWSSPNASSWFSARTSLHDQHPTTASSEQQQSKNEQCQANEGGPYSTSTLNVCAWNGLEFSEMDILTGLVSPGPLPEFALPPPLSNNNNNNNNLSSNNSVSIATLTPEHFLLSNHHQQQAGVNCRLSVQSPLRGSVSPFEHF